MKANFWVFDERLAILVGLVCNLCFNYNIINWLILGKDVNNKKDIKV